VSRALLTSSGKVVSRRLGNLGLILLTANFLASHMVHSVASARKDFQCWAFAALINLKYPCLESLATALSCGSFEARAFRDDVWNSFHSIVNSGDHHGLALIEGRWRGVWALRSVTRVSWCKSNLFSSEYLVERSGVGETLVSCSNSSRAGQSVLTQFGAGGDGGGRGGGAMIGYAIVIVMGTWSEPVAGRSVAQSWKKSIRDENANATSSTEGLEGP